MSQSLGVFTSCRSLLVLSLALVACGDPWMDAARVADRTEVIVVPVPRGPSPPTAFGDAVVATLARAAEADAIFVEVPPSDLARIEAAGARDPWVQAMPDVGALLAVARASGASVEPVSGWTAEVGRDWRAFITRGLPSDALYRRAHDHRVREDQDHGDELDWVLGEARRRLVEWEWRALEGAVPGALGAAAPSRVGAAHEAAFRAALDRHHGERILVAIDAKHASRIERAAGSDPDVRVVSPLAFESALDALGE